MKRRLNILCVIVVLVLSYSVFETGYYFIVGVKAGVEAGIDGNASEASQKKTDEHEVHQSVAGAPFRFGR